jgi:hypothetical protein
VAIQAMAAATTTLCQPGSNAITKKPALKGA